MVNSAEYQRTYYEKNKARITIRHQEWRDSNKERRKIADKKRYNELRSEILNHYGAVCDCCGESNYEFLAIDHMNGNGATHRKEIGRGRAFYYWILKNNFPDDLRVLCHNCNQSIGVHGYCPHNGNR